MNLKSAVSQPIRTLEWLLIVSGCALLLWCGLITVQARVYQAQESSTLDRGRRENRAGAPRKVKTSEHQLIGRLEIPRVGMSVVIVDGDDERTLRKAAGHLPDTPLPWEFGNSAVAGHRDSFFAPLKHVQVSDRVRLRTPNGDFQYVVSSIKIIDPTDISVLKTKGHSSLTLITCYPFYYVGNAPKRYIVQADHIPS